MSKCLFWPFCTVFHTVCVRCDGKYNVSCCKFITESISEKKLKICHLPKLCLKQEWHILFWLHHWNVVMHLWYFVTFGCKNYVQNDWVSVDFVFQSRLHFVVDQLHFWQWWLTVWQNDWVQRVKCHSQVTKFIYRVTVGRSDTNR